MFDYLQVIYIMLHSYNFAGDRIANAVLQPTFQYLNQWTNLEFFTEEPLLSAQNYFDNFPQEKELKWQVVLLYFKK